MSYAVVHVPASVVDGYMGGAGISMPGMASPTFANDYIKNEKLLQKYFASFEKREGAPSSAQRLLTLMGGRCAGSCPAHWFYAGGGRDAYYDRFTPVDGFEHYALPNLIVLLADNMNEKELNAFFMHVFARIEGTREMEAAIADLLANHGVGHIRPNMMPRLCAIYRMMLLTPAVQRVLTDDAFDEIAGVDEFRTMASREIDASPRPASESDSESESSDDTSSTSTEEGEVSDVSIGGSSSTEEYDRESLKRPLPPVHGAMRKSARNN